ncbi:4-(cytidine 5'-diphospho)-2-C-methyl-D-erythritol kinase [Sphingobium boeckii]|nr:4-(cytidine 5'-diphospho)-2-C-methyl-D-erythritol kinase [Sphingobium boeckii]
MLRETAWAKINLALHVRRRLADGYHDIESLFAFARDGDAVSLAPSGDLTLAIEGPFAAGLDAGPDNLVLRAAEALRGAFGISDGAALRLVKNLPVAAGIGGGSADAAAALRLLIRHWRIDPRDLRIAAIASALGADVPACLESRTLRGEGRGDAMAMLDEPELAEMPLLLVNPKIALATGPVFAGWDGVDRGPLDGGPALAAALAGRNDLEPPAAALVPEIATLVDALQALEGVRLARMSGSGATCFALFSDAAARARGTCVIRMRWPSYWCLETALK